MLKIIKLFVWLFPDISPILFSPLAPSLSFPHPCARTLHLQRLLELYTTHPYFMVARHKTVAHHRIRYPRYAWISRLRGGSCIYDFLTFPSSFGDRSNDWQISKLNSDSAIKLRPTNFTTAFRFCDKRISLSNFIVSLCNKHVIGKYK